MDRSSAASPAGAIEDGLDELLRAEREMARSLEAARAEAREIEDRARRHAEALRETRRVELENELREVEAVARRELEAEFTAVEREHRSLRDRYLAVTGERLEELARGVVARLLETLEEDLH